jgi:hypothetical protein
LGRGSAAAPEPRDRTSGLHAPRNAGEPEDTRPRPAAEVLHPCLLVMEPQNERGSVRGVPRPSLSVPSVQTRLRVSARSRVLGGERQDFVRSTAVAGACALGPTVLQKTRLRVSARSRVSGGERDKTPETCHGFSDLPAVWRRFFAWAACAVLNGCGAIG